MGGTDVETLNCVSMHGGLVNSQVASAIDTRRVCAGLLNRWREHGVPGYVQFDNDTRFLGPSNRPDILGTVPRMCLSLQVVPVFVPPREAGFQAVIESYNNLWQQKVWGRCHHPDLAALEAVSRAYVAASHQRHAQRIDGAPSRRDFPTEWSWNRERLTAHPVGQVVVIRRTTDRGLVTVLGHDFLVDAHWGHRLVRCDVDLDGGRIRFIGLRRAEPDTQPQLGEVEYHYPHKRYSGTYLD